MTTDTGRQLLLVVPAPGHAGRLATDVLTSAGVPEAPARCRALFEQVLRTVSPGATGGPDPATTATGRTRSLLRDIEVPSPAWWLPSPGAWGPGPLLDALGDAGFDPVAVLAWSDPGAVAAGRASETRAPALASWEMTVQVALEDLVGRCCIVVEAGTTTAGVLSDALPRVVPAVSVPGEVGTVDAWAWAGAAAHAGSGAADDVLPGQLALASALRERVGFHAALAPVEVPELSAWTRALVDAQRRARSAASDAARAWRYAHERGEDTEALWRALWHASTELAELAELADAGVEELHEDEVAEDKVPL